jgi:ATP-binding cassette subfamily F protein uup
MSLIALQNISIHFGGPLILDNVSVQIDKKQRICLLGRNGSGKSTLMKILAGEILPDEGLVQKGQATRISYFSQDIPKEMESTVFHIVAKGLGTQGALLEKYHLEEIRIADNPDSDHQTFNNLHDEMDKYNAWGAVEDINQILSRMALPADWQYNNLSGGQKRRVMLAAALVSKPDLLLLDEPTNHLDIDSINWMEEFLVRQNITLLFVTHDRMLLKRLATRIIELDRGKLADWSCDYETFLKRKQAVLDAEEKEWKEFDKKLSQEETWIRKGIKARRTRNEGRVRALKKMREERRARREKEGTATIRVSQAGLSGKSVIEARNITFSYDEEPLIKDFNGRISRGDKIGIIGPNGCGKTTLVNILLKKITGFSGTVEHGSNLAITYFDQLRGQLDDSKTVWENVIPHGDTVFFDGGTKHIISYLQDFLFTPERAKTSIVNLSGGERNRLLLAKLFTQPANFLILDEPTNDLDAETLELLEELMTNFSGTLLLISHDREFLNNVVTSIYVFGKNGSVKEYFGGYDDWLRQSKSLAVNEQKTPKQSKKDAYRQEKKARRKVKLSFNDTKELKALPAKIEKMESEMAALHAKMSEPGFYKNSEEVIESNAQLKKMESELAQAYTRWEKLESSGQVSSSGNS